MDPFIVISVKGNFNLSRLWLCLKVQICCAKVAQKEKKKKKKEKKKKELDALGTRNVKVNND